MLDTSNNINRSTSDTSFYEDDDEVKSADELLDIVGSFGTFQKVFCFIFICMFCLCSEFFRAIPFYTLQPKLDCYIQLSDLTFQVIENCPKELACNLPKN